jgi:hypothetical protein
MPADAFLANDRPILASGPFMRSVLTRLKRLEEDRAGEQRHRPLQLEFGYLKETICEWVLQHHRHRGLSAGYFDLHRAQTRNWSAQSRIALRGSIR